MHVTVSYNLKNITKCNSSFFMHSAVLLKLKQFKTLNERWYL